MSFMKQQSSPHAHSARLATSNNVMQQVLLATVPGIVALSWNFGPGTLINIVLCSLFCLSFEAAFLKLRGRNALFYIKDCSALVTAFLLGIALPAYAPWWLLVVGCFFAIVVAKQLYGGLGYNPFNPAMVAYVVLLISFPVEMTRWALDAGTLSSLSGVDAALPNLSQALQLVFTGHAPSLADGWTAATPLDVVKQSQGLTLDQLYQNQAIFNSAVFAGGGWEWVNIAFLLGGLYLLYKGVFTWHAPVAMLVSLLLLSALFYDGGSSASKGSPLFHLFSGATMFGAFFIVTDPVSSAVSTKGRLIYGACIGALVFVIRAWGNYPDAVAFAVLLMNFAAPFIDYYTLPRTYGHKKAQSGRVK
ncbi:electron transport complex subunit RsxD [Agaribacterium haliotis]|uniref:electron transport complex subunit RsxD n=1 Tax=Agaribacterium haliotis TaxID=2013869 RepID=UPI000BB57389|nr:electron transport complex subunit RsxD [Agaribacterium haliotis]